MITTKDIEHIAKLSRLEFDQNEMESFKHDLNQIVSYVNELQNVNTSFLNTQLNCVNAETQLRPDQPVQQFSQEQSVANAPVKKAGAFFVPTVME